MTTPDEVQRAVERVKETIASIRQKATPDQFGDDLANAYACQADAFDLLLSERAELLAAVERMRGGLESIAAYYPPGHRVEELARAALTTGEEK